MSILDRCEHRARVPRPIIIIGRVGIVALTRGYYAMIDAEDARAIGRHNWSTQINKHFPPRAFLSDRPNRRVIPMHRAVIDPPPGMDVDHINRNPLDNRRVNLRACTKSQNMANRARTDRNRSGAIGVSWSNYAAARGHAPWVARVQTQGRLWARQFWTKDEAIAARDAKVLEMHGEFAMLNAPKAYEQTPTDPQ